MGRLAPEFIQKVKDTVRINDVVGLRVALRRAGAGFKGLCPFHDDNSPSLHVDLRKNRYRCYACGANGDAIQFLTDQDGLDFVEAVNRLAEYYGIIPSDRPRLQRKYAPRQQRQSEPVVEDRRQIDKARALYFKACPAAGSVAESYLRSRAIATDHLPAGVLQQLRFLPDEPYWHTPKRKSRPEILHRGPVMVAPFQNSDGRVTGCHLTWLAADGSGKAVLADPDVAGKKLPAKKMKGRPWRCAIRLGPAAATMVLSEGIENGLTALMARPDWPVWVAGSLGNMAGSGLGQGDQHPKKPDRRLPSIHPDFSRPGLLLPPECKQLIILGESDGGDQPTVDALLRRAANRFARSGVDVRFCWAPKGKDHNDVLRGAM